MRSSRARTDRSTSTTALAVYPHEEPGIGPNRYNFDDEVLYQIHVATGADVAAGRATYSYQFRFTTRFRNRKTILQSYLGVINNVGDAAQNLIQSYTVTRINHRTGAVECLGEGIVPPNNQGNATPKYNQNDDGEQPARDGVATEAELDRYTRQSDRRSLRWLHRVRRPARRWFLRGHSGDFRPAEAASARARGSTRRADSTCTRWR